MSRPNPKKMLELWGKVVSLSLIPLFNKDCELVGWLEPDEHVFDTSMQWAAYVRNDHAWSADNGSWLGAIEGFVCRDTSGKPVAWNPDQVVSGTPNHQGLQKLREAQNHRGRRSLQGHRNRPNHQLHRVVGQP
ncbi:4-fold beta flower protein [Marinobacter sediminum]|uniref:4-fold beta flower protein n=1 Tax=Marinobacter sediminum TaxID=256323 RepID=UPI003EBC8AB4